MPSRPRSSRPSDTKKKSPSSSKPLYHRRSFSSSESGDEIHSDETRSAEESFTESVSYTESSGSFSEEPEISYNSVESDYSSVDYDSRSDSSSEEEEEKDRKVRRRDDYTRHPRRDDRHNRHHRRHRSSSPDRRRSRVSSSRHRDGRRSQKHHRSSKNRDERTPTKKSSRSREDGRRSSKDSSSSSKKKREEKKQKNETATTKSRRSPRKPTERKKKVKPPVIINATDAPHVKLTKSIPDYIVAKLPLDGKSLDDVIERIQKNQPQLFTKLTVACNLIYTSNFTLGVPAMSGFVYGELYTCLMNDKEVVDLERCLDAAKPKANFRRLPLSFARRNDMVKVFNENAPSSKIADVAKPSCKDKMMVRMNWLLNHEPADMAVPVETDPCSEVCIVVGGEAGSEEDPLVVAGVWQANIIRRYNLLCVKPKNPAVPVSLQDVENAVLARNAIVALLSAYLARDTEDSSASDNEEKPKKKKSSEKNKRSPSSKKRSPSKKSPKKEEEEEKAVEVVTPKRKRDSTIASWRPEKKSRTKKSSEEEEEEEDAAASISGEEKKDNGMDVIPQTQSTATATTTTTTKTTTTNNVNRDESSSSTSTSSEEDEESVDPVQQPTAHFTSPLAKKPNDASTDASRIANRDTLLAAYRSKQASVAK